MISFPKRFEEMGGFFSKKEKERGKERKKGMASIRYQVFLFFFFHREETFQFKFNFGPDPLKIPRFWDTNLCSPPRSMKQKKRKKEASRTRSFLYIQLHITSFVSRYSPEMLLPNQMKSTG